MTLFNRTFDVERAAKVLDRPESAWLRDLLRHWRPAGDRLSVRKQGSDADHLRLAIRDGYLNFYRAGQSVAKVEFNGEKLQAKIHNKYVYGQDGRSDSYIKVDAGGFLGSDDRRVEYREEHLHDWILNANKYSDEEKCFVDEFMAHNANVVDVEAGLPADLTIWEQKSAPRMDLVALEGCGDQWKIVVREAKLVTNGEARCREGSPKVISQLEKYQKWLVKNETLVRKVYQHTCTLLVELHLLAKMVNPDIEELGTGIVFVAGHDASLLDLECTPRLIIDDRTHNRAFTDNGHLQKLRDNGIQVEMIRSTADMVMQPRP